MIGRALLIAAIAMLAMPASADGLSPAPLVVPAAQDAGPADEASARGDCICRAQGRAYAVGQTVCLNTATGSRLATCGMVLNNTAWLFSQDACTVSSSQPPRPAVRMFSSTPSAPARSNGSSTSTKVSG